MSFGVNFPLAPLMARGNGMPCLAAACWQFTSSPRPCPRFSFFSFLLFFRGGHARRERAAAAVGVIDGRTADFSYFSFSHHEKNQIIFFLFVSTTTAGIIFCAGHAKVAVTRLVCCDIGRRLHAGRKTMAQPVPVPPNGQRARSIISRGRKTFSFFFPFFFCKYITSSGHLVWLAIIIVWPPAKS